MQPLKNGCIFFIYSYMKNIYNYDYFVLNENKKLKSELEQKLYNLWRTIPEQYKDSSVEWKYSFACAIKNGIIRDEIIALELNPYYADRLNSTYIFGDNLYVYSNIPNFYKEYKMLCDMKSKLSEIEHNKIYIVTNLVLDISKMPKNLYYLNGKIYNADTDEIYLQDKLQLSFNIRDISAHGNNRLYGNRPTIQNPNPLFENLNSLGKIDINYVEQYGGYYRFETKDVFGNIVYKDAIVKLNNDISELENKISNLTYDETNIQENPYIQEFVLKAIDKYAKIIKNNSKTSDELAIEKEKKQQAKNTKAEKIENDREQRIIDLKIPTTIDEFLKHTEIKNCNDAAIGDLVMFKEAVFSGKYPNAKYEGDRRILALIESDSYGSQKGQHTFSLYVLDSDGIDEYSYGEKIRRKGRTLYKDCMTITYASDDVRDNKHDRGADAKENKYWSYWNEYQNGKEWKLDKIPSWFLTKHKLNVTD